MRGNREDRENQNNAHYKAADELYRKGRYREALPVFEFALKAVPNDCDSLWAIADCHSELGNPDLAEQFFRAALKNCPPESEADILYNLGNALFDQEKFKQAIELYRTIPKNTTIYEKAQKNIRAAKTKIERY